MGAATLTAKVVRVAVRVAVKVIGQIDLTILGDTHESCSEKEATA